MKAIVFSENRKGVFSGGRYHGLMIAEALACKGHEVSYVTNNEPVFYENFAINPTHKNIDLIISDDFQVDFDSQVDLVFLIPGQSGRPNYYNQANLLALKHKAKFVLVNFESGNWFNELSPFKRDLKIWDLWRYSCRFGACVLSSLNESEKYAKEFYTDYPNLTSFDVWSPAINSAVADKYLDTPKENSILMFCRFSDKHKGGNRILALLPNNLNDWKLYLVFGSRQNIPMAELNEIKTQLESRGAQVDIQYSISEDEKFQLISKCKLLLFPTYFEGYGYPPLEAFYCNTYCIAYELPALKETCKDVITLVERGNESEFSETVSKFIDGRLSFDNDLRSVVFDRVNFEAAANNLDKVISRIAATEYKLSFADMLRKQKFIISAKLFNVVSKPLSKILGKLGFGRQIQVLIKQKGWLFFSKVFIKMILSLGKEKVFRSGISKIDRIDVDKLFVRGWALGNSKFDSMRVSGVDGHDFKYSLDLQRDDVFCKYPYYKNRHSGFEVVVSLSKELQEKTSIQLDMLVGDNKVGSQIVPMPNNS